MLALAYRKLPTDGSVSHVSSVTNSSWPTYGAPIRLPTPRRPFRARSAGCGSNETTADEPPTPCATGRLEDSERVSEYPSDLCTGAPRPQTSSKPSSRSRRSSVYLGLHPTPSDPDPRTSSVPRHSHLAAPERTRSTPWGVSRPPAPRPTTHSGRPAPDADQLPIASAMFGSRPPKMTRLWNRLRAGKHAKPLCALLTQLRTQAISAWIVSGRPETSSHHAQAIAPRDLRSSSSEMNSRL